MEKVLKFEKPMISFKPASDCIFGILQAHGEKLYHVILENYLNIVYDGEYPTNQFVNFTNQMEWRCYDCFNYTITSHFVAAKAFGDMASYIKWSIENDSYVLVALNTKYIKNYSTYQKRDYQHQCFFYGFNEDEGYFYAADFFDFTNYSLQKVKFSEVNLGAEFLSFCKEVDFLDGATTFNVNPHYDRTIDINKIYRGLSQLINDEKLKRLDLDTTNFLRKRWFGLGFFGYLCSYMEALTNRQTLDKRSFHFICEHIKLMGLRIDFFLQRIENDELKELRRNCSTLYESAIAVRNLVIKDHLVYMKSHTHDFKAIKSAINLLYRICEKYRMIIEKLINFIEAEELIANSVKVTKEDYGFGLIDYK